MEEREEVPIAAGLRLILGIAWYLALLALAVLAIRAILALAGSPAAGGLEFSVPFRMDLEAYAVESARHGVEGAHIREAEGTLELQSASPSLVALSTAHALLWVGGALLVIRQLRKIFETLAAGDPFVAANAGRLQAIGLVIIAFDIARALLKLGQSLYLRGALETSGVQIRILYCFSAEVLFLGFALLAVAEVFRIGTRLREDQALTV